MVVSDDDRPVVVADVASSRVLFEEEPVRRTQLDSDAPHPRFTGNRFAALQCEDTEDPLRHSDALVSPANSNVSHQRRFAVVLESQRKRMRVRHSQATTVEVCPETVEILEFDLTRADTDESDTKSSGENQPCTSSETVEVDVEPEAVPVNREVRAVSNLFNVLARRVGASSVEADLPRGIPQQKWSPVYVPLLWAAARGDESTPVLDWLVERAHFIDEAIQFHGGDTEPSVALTTAWAALRQVMRSWGIRAREDLSDWLGQHGFLRSSHKSDPPDVPQRRQSCIVGNRLRGDCPLFGKVNNAQRS